MSMNELFFRSIHEIQIETAKRFKKRRKEWGISQQELAAKTGVSLGSLRRFEQTGEISFASLVRLAQHLEAVDDIDNLFATPHYRSIQDIIRARKESSK